MMTSHINDDITYLYIEINENFQIYDCRLIISIIICKNQTKNSKITDNIQYYGLYLQVMHYHKDLEVIHSVLIEEDFISPKASSRYKALILLISPRNENLNLLVWMKFLNSFLYSS
jgi:hypothetical protein